MASYTPDKTVINNSDAVIKTNGNEKEIFITMKVQRVINDAFVVDRVIKDTGEIS